MHSPYRRSHASSSNGKTGWDADHTKPLKSEIELIAVIKRRTGRPPVAGITGNKLNTASSLTSEICQSTYPQWIELNIAGSSKHGTSDEGYCWSMETMLPENMYAFELGAERNVTPKKSEDFLPQIDDTTLTLLEEQRSYERLPRNSQSHGAILRTSIDPLQDDISA